MLYKNKGVSQILRVLSCGPCVFSVNTVPWSEEYQQGMLLIWELRMCSVPLLIPCVCWRKLGGGQWVIIPDLSEVFPVLSWSELLRQHCRNWTAFELCVYCFILM